MGKVLIIDDDVQILRALRALLEREGYEVLVTIDGTTGSRLCKEEAVDVVITDILMPEKDGLELIIELRRDCPGVKIVAMSGGGGGLGQEDLLYMARGLGASDVLCKPFSVAEVLRAVRKAFENRP
ncbi:MAG: response regulator [Deltaproteobacteria bacterium]|nr:response regulator [Deltaproteobacteria bacterium]